MSRILMLLSCFELMVGCAGAGDGVRANTTDKTDTTAQAPDAKQDQAVGNADGTNGTDGNDGLDGTDGTDGMDGTDGTDGADGMDGTDGNDGTDNAVFECTGAKATGAISTKEADIVFPGVAADALITYAPDSGCMTGLIVNLNLNGGCKLSMDINASSGSWAVSNASFVGDEKCGEFWPGWATGTFVFSKSASFAGFAAPPTLAEGATCWDGKLALSGRLRFFKDNVPLDLVLDGLKLTAKIPAKAGDTTTCASPYVAPCPPAGPYGTKLGDVMKDLKIFDCDGNAVYLHELCGEKAAFLNLFAAW